eukprot:UN34730
MINDSQNAIINLTTATTIIESVSKMSVVLDNLKNEEKNEKWDGIKSECELWIQKTLQLYVGFDKKKNEASYGSWTVVTKKQDTSKEQQFLNEKLDQFKFKQEKDFVQRVDLIHKANNFTRLIALVITDFAYDPMETFWTAGVQHDIDVTRLRHWKLHYCQPYIHRTQVEDISPPRDHTFKYFFWGAKKVSS